MKKEKYKTVLTQKGKRKKPITEGRYIAVSGEKITEGLHVGQGVWLFKTGKPDKLTIFSLKEIVTV